MGAGMTLPQEMPENIRVIISALTAITGFEPVQVLNAQPNYLRVLGRMQSQNVAILRKVAMSLYAEGPKRGFGADLSKYYFPREPGGMEDVYAWRVILESTGGEPLPVQSIIPVIQNVTHADTQAVRVQMGNVLEEIPLNTSANMNVPNARGKGAYVAGTFTPISARRGYNG